MQIFDHSFRIQELMVKVLAAAAENPEHKFASHALNYTVDVS